MLIAAKLNQSPADPSIHSCMVYMIWHYSFSYYYYFLSLSLFPFLTGGVWFKVEPERSQRSTVRALLHLSTAHVHTDRSWCKLKLWTIGSLAIIQWYSDGIIDFSSRRNKLSLSAQSSEAGSVTCSMHTTMLVFLRTFFLFFLPEPAS